MNQTRNVARALPNRAWLGKECFIIGGGTSLTIPPEALKGKLTIGVNKAFIKYNPTITYMMDIKLYESIMNPSPSEKESEDVKKRWMNYGGVKIILDERPRYPYKDGTYEVRRIMRPEVSTDIVRGIFGGSCSGFGALMLAICLGVKTAYLLGFDFYVDMDTLKTHWHRGYKGQSPRILDNKLCGFTDIFRILAPKINERINVVNLNPRSRLRCFPFKTPEEVFNHDTQPARC